MPNLWTGGDFETDPIPNGWELIDLIGAGNALWITGDPANAHGGTGYVRLLGFKKGAPNPTSQSGKLKRVVTGLTPGKTYLLQYWFKNTSLNSNRTLVFAIDGVTRFTHSTAQAAYTTPAGGAFAFVATQAQHIFTWTATIGINGIPATIWYIDDAAMTVPQELGAIGLSGIINTRVAFSPQGAVAALRPQGVTRVAFSPQGAVAALRPQGVRARFS